MQASNLNSEMVLDNSSTPPRLASELASESLKKCFAMVSLDVMAETEADQRRRMAEREGWFSMLLRNAGSRSCDFTFGNYKCGTPYQTRCLQAVKDWANAGNAGLRMIPNLILRGPVGTGKDHLAIAACKTICLQHGVECGFLSVQEWYGTIRDAMNGGISERDLIRRYSRYPLLVLSDPLPPFGNLTQHQATMLYRLVSERANARLSNIVTINVSDDQEAYERIGAPTWDRILEDALVVQCNWPSHRQPRRRITNLKDKP